MSNLIIGDVDGTRGFGNGGSTRRNRYRLCAIYDRIVDARNGQQHLPRRCIQIDAPDETVFVELSVRLSERAGPAGRESEIAGRQSTVASDNVYIQQRSRQAALETIATTTRLVPR